VLAGVDLVLVRDLAAVKPVLQHQIERAAGEALAAGQRAAGSLALFAHDAHPIELGLQQRHRAKFRIAPKNKPDDCRFGLIYDQFAVLNIVAERHIATYFAIRNVGLELYYRTGWYYLTRALKLTVALPHPPQTG
jgi:hypothetical protein